MSLQKQIDADIILAMKSKDADKLRALRGLKLAFSKVDKPAGVLLTDAEALTVVQKQIKNGQESATTYITQGRQDLADIENSEVTVFQSYLPAQLSTDEVTEIVKAVISEVEATTIRDMGKVMGNSHIVALAGSVDKKTLSEIIKTQLG